ncbi:cysteine--tRNA ligase [Candidatus Woesearchaeota archaeon]|jgi:cysteinyl-tRNA synthetase|nr:cysteine--tRNA ligase [Candidatus Woesearchaeota archaeon]MBT4835308.1 cysteine--tRNA ligase [Candidatus Woesearchaeota archaeon]MBT6734768.1 cysteine--tRNA ligase [Candidatus Woesearchaeota archaeon]MBT7169555.1 cysteine--tRNA ligase [Candidatus Woesearchaeota archaeon]MBT7474357.1 cysteine--tRNA ligase [Candidatus Woesearchaeota archaeon]
MEIKIYNTLSKKLEKFKPLDSKNVRIYVCGATVNDVPHLGHAKQQISFDILRKFLIFMGYGVKYVSNITDIEDKIIKKSNELNIPINELTKKNEEIHKEDYKKINVLAPDVQPHATKYISEMIDLIERLEKKGFTYSIEGDGIYYDISKYKKYGSLSRQKIGDLQSGTRVKINENKKNPGDFVLWKFSKNDEPSWESPWGGGRPGWHIECSAMSHSILGLPFDIHAGGQDLIFPHHEDEIAQSEAGYGEKMANYWMHNGMVNVNGEKMSKSLNNFKTIRELLKAYSPMVIRYFVVSSHYRKPTDFSTNALNDSKNSYERIKRLTLELKDDGKINKKSLELFKKAMSEDLNTSKALAVVWELLRDSSKNGKYQFIKKIDEVFCLDLLKEDNLLIPIEISVLAKDREKARKEKDWKKSDAIRDELLNKGWTIEDSSKGPKLNKKIN